MPFDITSSELGELKELRHKLHQHAELSCEEKETARLIKDELEQTGPDELVTGIGGTGLAAIYHGDEDGQTVMFRAELDALPIHEKLEIDHASKNEGVAHKCGHDGHMAIVSGLARKAGKQGIKRGKLITLFQPAEETGQGAMAMLEDKKFKKLKPDFGFALHNLPGFPVNSIISRAGVFASASRGLIIRLKGHTSHAGHPEDGNSPALAAATLIKDLTALPPMITTLSEAALITIIHARVGRVAFGTTPGEAEVMATLRSHEPEVMDRLIKHSLQLAEKTAEAYNLKMETDWTEIFEPNINSKEHVKLVDEISKKAGLKVITRKEPFPWSEDFGQFLTRFPGVLFGLGAGEKAPQLHHGDYDFPDELIEGGLKVFAGLTDHYLEFK